MLSVNPREPSLALFLVPIAQIEVTAGKRSGRHLAAVVGRRELVIIQYDGISWHDGELVVTPIVASSRALPQAAEVCPPE